MNLAKGQTFLSETNWKKHRFLILKLQLHNDLNVESSILRQSGDEAKHQAMIKI